jgi:hypothetical protein
MFEKGDNFLHFTKYGGVNKGEVAYVGYILIVSSTNGVVYRRPYINTTNNVRLNLDGTDGKIYKIERELSPEDSKSMVNIADKMGQRKAQIQFDIQEKINSGQLKLPNND